MHVKRVRSGEPDLEAQLPATKVESRASRTNLEKAPSSSHGKYLSPN